MDASNQIHIAKNDRKIGPFTAEQVKDMLASGAFAADDLYWKKGMIEWVPLSQSDFLPDAPPPIPRRGAVPPIPTAGGYPPPINTDNTPAAFWRNSRGKGYAGFWRRVGAVLIAALIIGIPVAIVAICLAANGKFNSGWYNSYSREYYSYVDSSKVFAFISITQNVLFLLYYIICESSKMQGTIGKLTCGIRVTDTNGNRISFWRALGRYLARFINGFTLGIGVLMCAWTERKQCLHDKIAGCYFVKR